MLQKRARLAEQLAAKREADRRACLAKGGEVSYNSAGDVQCAVTGVPVLGGVVHVSPKPVAALNYKWPSLTRDEAFDAKVRDYTRGKVAGIPNFQMAKAPAGTNNCGARRVMYPYQRLVGDWASENNPNTNLLVWHSTGSGKTCVMVAVIRGFRQPGQPQPRINVIAPKKNISNFYDTVVSGTCVDEAGRPMIQLSPNLVAELRDRANTRVTAEKVCHRLGIYAYSYQEFANRLNNGATATNSDKWPATGIDGSVVLFDEAHNLVSEDTRQDGELRQETKDLQDAYKALKKAKDMRLFLLTATPIKNELWELGRLLDLLKPGTFPTTKREWAQRYGEVTQASLADFARKARGLVSYYNGENDRSRFALAAPTRGGTAVGQVFVANRYGVVTTRASEQQWTKWQEAARNQNVKGGEGKEMKQRLAGLSAQIKALKAQVVPPKALKQMDAAAKTANSELKERIKALEASKKDLGKPKGYAVASHPAVGRYLRIPEGKLEAPMAAANVYKEQAHNTAVPADLAAHLKPHVRKDVKRNPETGEVLASADVISKILLGCGEFGGPGLRKLLADPKQGVSPKLMAMVDNIKRIKGKHMVFSFSTPAYGTMAARAALLCAGMEEVVFDRKGRVVREASTPGKGFVVLPADATQEMLTAIVGDTSDDSSYFNGDGNRRGQRCRVILLDKKYTQGISLYAVNTVHLLDQSSSLNMRRQAIARAVRGCGHRQLPGPDKGGASEWFVTVISYASTSPDGAMLSEGQALVDAVQGAQAFDSYLTALRGVAIDAGLYPDQ